MKHKGFTLIELLVAIFIMVLLVLTAIPQFQKFGKKSQTQGTASEIKALIEKTRTFAMAPREQDSNITNYQIEINKNGNWVIKGVKEADQSVEVEKGEIDSRTEIAGFFYNTNQEIFDTTAILGFETPSGRAIRSLNNNKRKLDIIIQYKNTNISARVSINLISSQVEVSNN